MSSRSLKIAARLALLLCVALVVVSVRSFWIADAWGLSRANHSVQLGLAKGRLRLDTTALGPDGGRWGNLGFAHACYRAADDPPNTRLPTRLGNLGFSAEHRVRDRNYESYLVLIPAWLPLLILTALTGLLRRKARSVLRSERRRAGLCTHCGYDVRSAAARCPECGIRL